MTKQQKSLEDSTAEFMNAVGLLIRRIRAAMTSDTLSLTEAATLSRLEKDGPMTIAELARAESVKPQSMGTIVAALEAEGLVGRKPHPTDGRQMNISLTAKGVAARNGRKEAKHSWLTQAMAQLSEKERDILFKAGAIIKRLSEK